METLVVIAVAAILLIAFGLGIIAGIALTIKILKHTEDSPWIGI